MDKEGAKELKKSKSKLCRLHLSGVLDKTAGWRVEISKMSEVRMKYRRNLFGIPADPVKNLIFQ